MEEKDIIDMSEKEKQKLKNIKKIIVKQIKSYGFW